MSRRLIFLPFGALVLLTAVLALLLGGRMANTTETEVIERVVAIYLGEAGAEAARTDCRAVPAQSEGLWLVITCASQDGVGFEYFIDRFGRVADRKPFEGQA
ncbi:hypothetical protein [Roseovarius rhodophyticola]|uniref:Uncharacterized protein n=1 Tax=Roseovarius rhodophyticola TaxID=3080827 RepID=A0ABZ2TGW1_9RHOB|nr:hypothetical protein [Roseovarius sp. W115]MDV2931425.1 hypothetical protein [Roseovarius sp. W115]